MGHHRKRILVIEDEEDIASLVKLQAESAGYQVRIEVNGIDGYKAVEKDHPDLVLLDIMLPGQNGLDVCRKIKSHPQLRNIPVIMLTAKSEELDIILGLELGADDYVAKPFSPKILLSRMKAVLRRHLQPEDEANTIVFGPFSIDIERYLLKKEGVVQQVTLSEFGILSRLLKHRGKVLTRNQLLDDLQEDEGAIVDRNIDVHIASLRKKLGPHFHWIETVRGVGYRFKDEASS